MIQLFLSAGVAILLFVSLYLLSRRASAEGGAESLLRARSALDLLQGRLLPTELVQRLFTKADLNYVAGNSTGEVEELFVRERKRIALMWVNQILQQIRKLQEFHLGSARFYSRLSLRTELRLAFEFFALMCICRMLQVALYLRGPYAAPRMVGRVAVAAASVCAKSEEAMSFLSPVKMDSMAGDSARNMTAL